MGGHAKHHMAIALEKGTPEFRAYAAYVLESLPDINVPTLREMFKHNASVQEYLSSLERIKDKRAAQPKGGTSK